MTPTVIAAVALTVFIGAGAQRVTGMGFSLVVAPFLILTLGPIHGVILTNWCSIVAASTNLSTSWRQLDWRRLAILSPAAAAGCLPGFVLVRYVPSAILAMVVSLLTLTALVMSMTRRTAGGRDGTLLRAGAGFASGFLAVSAGVGGPPVAIYRQRVGWPHLSFVASAQFHFAVTGIAALVAKWQAPNFPLSGWLVLGAAIVLGSLVGRALSHRLPSAVALRLVMWAACGGTIFVFVRALASVAQN